MISSHGEVSGRKYMNGGDGASGFSGSTPLFANRIKPIYSHDRSKESEATIPCDPCRNENNTVAADRYCNHCNEYLCQTCVRFHKKFSATSNHSLQSISNTSNAVDFGPAETRQQGIKEITLHDMVPIYYDEINVKTSFDRYDCNITGCDLLSSGNLVLCDKENNSLKVIERKKRIIISFNFDSSPWDLTVTKEQEIAVSLPYEKKIELFTLFSTDISRARKRSLKVDDICMGLDYFTDHLIVSYPFKLEIISLRDNVEVKGIVNITASSRPVEFDPGPWYLAVSQVHKQVYVSCRNSNEVLRIPINGERVYRRVKGDINYPAGLCVVNASELLLCDWDSHKIELIGLGSRSGKKVILDEQDRLKHPQALCYCSKQRKLFVSSYWFDGDPSRLNNLKVFQFSPLDTHTEC